MADSRMWFFVLGMAVGCLLGVNLHMLYRRFFGGNVERIERNLQAQIRDLESRLRRKDEAIREAIQIARNEERSGKA